MKANNKLKIRAHLRTKIRAKIRAKIKAKITDSRVKRCTRLTQHVILLLYTVILSELYCHLAHLYAVTGIKNNNNLIA